MRPLVSSKLRIDGEDYYSQPYNACIEGISGQQTSRPLIRLAMSFDGTMLGQRQAYVEVRVSQLGSFVINLLNFRCNKRIIPVRSQLSMVNTTFQMYMLHVGMVARYFQFWSPHLTIHFLKKIPKFFPKMLKILPQNLGIFAAKNVSLRVIFYAFWSLF